MREAGSHRSYIFTGKSPHKKAHYWGGVQKKAGRKGDPPEKYESPDRQGFRKRY